MDDTIWPDAMDGTVNLLQLLYRSESERRRHPAEPPADTAARVLAWAGERLDRQDVRYLVAWARSAFERDGIPPELRLSPRTVNLIDRDELPADPESDRTALLVAGLVEYERFFSHRDDTISLDRLCERYRSERERDPVEPPLDTAARVLAWAGERLAGHDVRQTVSWARSAFERDGIPPELRLSPRTVTLIERLDRPPYPLLDPDARLAAALVERERTALLSAGLVECERSRAVDADLAAGRRTLRDLTAADYIDRQTTDTISFTTFLIRNVGWIPVGIVAIVAGTVVASISGDWSRLLLTAFSGTILGYAAAIGAIIIYSTVDERRLRLGQLERAWWSIFLCVGFVVPLLVAVVVPNNDAIVLAGVGFAVVFIIWWAGKTGAG